MRRRQRRKDSGCGENVYANIKIATNGKYKIPPYSDWQKYL
jgi:hypothetical protein